ncbi:MAG: thiamine-phosphate kinase [Candidatus Odinarchaeum yellowstonii]|uniref:Thiamine-monophosphate kinase n=1 Tax=Odinarchaeota yellowstonii (strain LCB_4) TaxID=1841599 RepID=A0AAF0IDB5_ODILC|nr:MAG: thiamine-phosphate kinase [Candidatus Odinarchaeum yellowstonii]
MDKDVTVSGVGERRLVDLFMELLGESDVNLLPHPDDAVAVRFGDKLLVFKTDMFVASTDMPPKMSFYEVGWKTVIMNISDLASKGAVPLYFLSSIGMPGSFKLKDSLDLLKGIREAASEYGVKVLGGDLGECKELVVAGFLIGSSPSGRLIPRKGAEPGDMLAVTGCFGLTAAALKTFMRHLKVDVELENIFRKALFKPAAKVKEGLALANCKGVSSCIDSSDGLLESLLELGKVNNVGFIVEDVPVCELIEGFAGEYGFNILDLVFRGGEEYELVATIRPENVEEVLKTVRETGGELKIIGRVIKEPRIFCDYKGERIELKNRGYEHFKNR